LTRYDYDAAATTPGPVTLRRPPGDGTGFQRVTGAPWGVLRRTTCTRSSGGFRSCITAPATA